MIINTPPHPSSKWPGASGNTPRPAFSEIGRRFPNGIDPPVFHFFMPTALFLTIKPTSEPVVCSALRGTEKYHNVSRPAYREIRSH